MYQSLRYDPGPDLAQFCIVRRTNNSPPISRTKRGRIGESLAGSFLELQGFELLRRNVRVGPREIDLVVADDHWWIVVEVRLRRVSTFGRAEDSVDRRKREQLLRAGQELWCLTDRCRPLRFDLVTLALQTRTLELRHHPFFLDPDRPPRAR